MATPTIKLVKLFGLKGCAFLHTIKVLLSFFLLGIIISSVVLLSIIPPSDARLSSLCAKLPLYGTYTKANGFSSPNLPSYARDNNLGTRWSNSGLPSWIEYDLGISRSICYVDIAWYRGDLRVHSFTISVSNDGANYQNVFTGSSSGSTASFERYNFPDSYAKYLRITINGNSESNIASITEFSLYTNCIELKPSTVYANGNDGNVPQMPIDNNLGTRWSNSGLPSWIEYELASSRTICYLDIAWYRGDSRINPLRYRFPKIESLYQTI